MLLLLLLLLLNMMLLLLLVLQEAKGGPGPAGRGPMDVVAAACGAARGATAAAAGTAAHGVKTLVADGHLARDGKAGRTHYTTT